jgi:hypothetical protein
MARAVSLRISSKQLGWAEGSCVKSRRFHETAPRGTGNCFPQLGPQLFVITGEAATSRPRSSPILMGCGLHSLSITDRRC